jgi:zinc transporter 1/2/3
MIGVSAPLFTRSIPALHPDRSLFVIVKAFAAGIILATGFMHVLPDSFDMLSSSCLPENPWHKFPFTGFLAMLSAIVTLMVDSLATSVYSKKSTVGVNPESITHGAEPDEEMAVGYFHGHGNGHGHHYEAKLAGGAKQLLRYRVVAMVRFHDFVYSSIIGI